MRVLKNIGILGRDEAFSLLKKINSLLRKKLGKPLQSSSVHILIVLDENLAKKLILARLSTVQFLNKKAILVYEKHGNSY